MLAYQRYGDGRSPVVLLHGFLGSGRNLSTLARRLAERDPSLSIVVPDLTGHGASPPLPPGADLATVARDVHATARSAGLQGPLELLGHSLGGKVALEVLRLYPEDVSRVALLDIAPGPIPTGVGGSEDALALLLAAPARAARREEFREALSRGPFPRAIVDWLLMNVVRDGEGYTWRVDREALARFHDRLRAADAWEVVEGHVRPIRCIRGGRSPYVTDADVRRLEAAGCPVQTLPGAGHFLHAEALDLLVEALASPFGFGAAARSPEHRIDPSVDPA
jgi:esterase